MGVEMGRIWCDNSVGMWRREKGGGLVGQLLTLFHHEKLRIRKDKRVTNDLGTKLKLRSGCGMPSGLVLRVAGGEAQNTWEGSKLKCKNNYQMQLSVRRSFSQNTK